MDNQSNDQPLKWIERIKYGLFMKGYFVSNEFLDKEIFNAIFTDIKERESKIKNTIDIDVTFEGKAYLYRQFSSSWKLLLKDSIPYKLASNLSNNNIPNNSPKQSNKKDNGNQTKDSPLQKELDELRNINQRLAKLLNQKQITQGIMDPEILNIIINCNYILIKIIEKNKKRNWMEKIERKKQDNIEKYKRNHSWIPEEKWIKLSFFDKIIKRWNFSDMHQCLIPWEEKKLSKEELDQFHQKKESWRIIRAKELENNPEQKKVFDKFCHARKIGNKILYNLDKRYMDSFSKKEKKTNSKIIHQD